MDNVRKTEIKAVIENLSYYPAFQTTIFEDNSEIKKHFSDSIMVSMYNKNTTINHPNPSVSGQVVIEEMESSYYIKFFYLGCPIEAFYVNEITISTPNAKIMFTKTKENLKEKNDESL